MSASEIKDKDSLEAWLKTRPEGARHADGVAIAQRAALRVLPFYLQEIGEAWAIEAGLMALPALRVSLISGVVRKYPGPKTRRAAGNAIDGTVSLSTSDVFIGPAPAKAVDAAYAAARTSVENAAYERAAVAAANSFLAAAHTYSRVPMIHVSAAAPLHESRYADARLLEQGEDPCAHPLWPEREPEPFRAAWQESQKVLRGQGVHWDFWLRWFEGARTGRQIPWAVQRDVALIRDALWDEGPEAIAKEIARIEAAHERRQEEEAAQEERQHEEKQHEEKQRTKPSDDTGPGASARRAKWVFETHSTDTRKWLDLLLSCVEEALKELEALGGNNPPPDVDGPRQKEMKRLKEQREVLWQIRALVPGEGAQMRLEDAEEADSLVRLYKKEFENWFRENAGEVVDGAARITLISLGAGFLGFTGALLGGGVSAIVPLSMSGVLFGGKKIVKVVRDLWKRGDKADAP